MFGRNFATKFAGTAVDGAAGETAAFVHLAMRRNSMKTLGKPVVGAALLLTLLAGGSQAANITPPSGTFVHWESILGIVDPMNTVGGVTGAGLPWSTLGGQAAVDLTNGTVEFEVHGLVLAAGNAIGTPGAVTQVAGTLVCNAAATPTVVSTSPVTLDAQGNAAFKGTFSASTDACTATSVAFLITVVPSTSASSSATGPWIAYGAVPGTFSFQSPPH
jgi:hypothetical protein